MFEQDYLELIELQQIIQEGIEGAVPGQVRVRAEVAQIQQRTNGHCYIDLCQSDGSGIVAKMKAIIWRSLAGALLSRFADDSGSALQAGMAVVFEGRVSYSELYGVSLIVDDIDVGATLGEAELQRRRTIERLEKEGLLELQKEFALPRVPYRLAVISAPDAAGYGDFLRHLLENEYGFAFDVTLFEATMQGDGAPASIIAALDRAAAAQQPTIPLHPQGTGGVPPDTPCVASLRGSDTTIPLHPQGTGGVPPDTPCVASLRNDRADCHPERSEGSSFDAVLILRGGGSSLDLACFDDYELCAAIARCPIPVCTAIGHDRDSHAADEVACISVKTPTALADLFIDAVAAEDELISSYGNRLRLAFSGKIAVQTAATDKIRHRIHFALNHIHTAADASLSKLETRIVAANPRRLLERGYTLVTGSGGALLKRAADANPGERIKVLYPDGNLKCTIIEIERN